MRYILIDRYLLQKDVVSALLLVLYVVCSAEEEISVDRRWPGFANLRSHVTPNTGQITINHPPLRDDSGQRTTIYVNLS